MKIKLTALTVKNLSPALKPVEYFDENREKGAGAFGIRVSPKGAKTWFLLYSPAGSPKRKRLTLGKYPVMQLSEAREAAMNFMVKVNAGEDPQQAKAEYRAAETFADLWRDYIQSPKYLKKSIAGQKEEQRKFDRHLKNSIGPMKVQDIRIKHLSPVLYDLAKTAPVSANRLHALLSFVFKFGLNRGIIEIHPMFGMDKPSKEQPRKRHLTSEEIKILWPAFDNFSPAVRDIYRLILLTAQRPGEVMAMERGEINLDERTWTIPWHKAKNKNEHIVPLSDQALRIIKPLLEQDTRFLFPSDSKSGHISTTVKSRSRFVSMEDKPWSNMPWWTAHDLRRTARTMLSRLKVKSDIAERILNHARGRIEATYDLHAYLDEKRTALDKLGREIDWITGHDVRGEVIALRRAG